MKENIVFTEGDANISLSGKIGYKNMDRNASNPLEEDKDLIGYQFFVLHYPDLPAT